MTWIKAFSQNLNVVISGFECRIYVLFSTSRKRAICVSHIMLSSSLCVQRGARYIETYHILSVRATIHVDGHSARWLGTLSGWMGCYKVAKLAQQPFCHITACPFWTIAIFHNQQPTKYINKRKCNSVQVITQSGIRLIKIKFFHCFF